ncbi:MAG: type I restriction-modification system subunit M [Mycoplasma sp.]
MAIENKQKKQQSELHTQLWAMSNDLRGNMDPNEFKNYILGLLFFQYLSDRLEKYINKELESDNLTYEAAWKNEEYKATIIDSLMKDLRYVIPPKYLWSSLINDIKSGNFECSKLEEAKNALIDSTIGKPSEKDFENLFDDMDLNSSKLGKYSSEKDKLISKLMLKINEISYAFDDCEIDVLGDAYEYLIGQFAANAGKKSGEFYTPQQVSKILAKIVTLNKSKIKNVYDPTCGSGSLLLRVKRETDVTHFYGQENISTTYNLARMNMLLHGVKSEQFNIANDDTLERPDKDHLSMRFDAIVANPPYSATWSSDETFLDDERFSSYGKLAPKSKADYAFIQHMIYLLDDKGTMAVVLPHGVLFRGAAEKVIRQHLIKDKNYLDAIIGLPANLFFGTSIPTCILIFKKCREDDKILFIDASKEFESKKNQNMLTDENIEKIMNTYANRSEVEKYSHLATLKEIEENEYNLNIPRYVDTFEEEEEIDIKQVMSNIKKLESERDELDKEINKYLKELGIE